MKSYQEEKDNTICKICGEKWLYLGSHINKAHKITTKHYKGMYGLSYNYSLMSDEVMKKKKKAFEEGREKYLKNLTQDFAFKKGQYKKTYVSKQSLIKSMKNIINANKEQKEENCPVCNMKFNHLDSHLYNKHGLLRAKNENK